MCNYVCMKTLKLKYLFLGWIYILNRCVKFHFIGFLLFT